MGHSEFQTRTKGTTENKVKNNINNAFSHNMPREAAEGTNDFRERFFNN